MADIRYNISGTSKPYLVELFNPSGIKVCQTIIENNGGNTETICGNSLPINIFPSLSGNTEYLLKVTDCIGNIGQQYITTCSNLPPYTKPTRTFNLNGSNVCTSIYNEPLILRDTLSINRPMVQGETATLSVGIQISSVCNLNVNGQIWCKPNTGSNYLCLINLNDNGNGSQGISQYKTITLNSGDEICYNLSSTPTNPSISTECKIGTGIVKISGITSNDFTVNTNNVFRYVETTYSYTEQPIPVTGVTQKISIGSQNNIGHGTNVCYCGKICVSPPLTIGQSFNLCIVNGAEIISNNALPDTISSKSFVNWFGGELNPACATLNSGTPGSPNNWVPYSLSITPETISGITLYATANTTQPNLDYCYTNASRVVLTTPFNSIGGNFVVDNDIIKSIMLAIGYDKSYNNG